MKTKRLIGILVLGLGLTLALLAGLQMAHAGPAASTRYVAMEGTDGGGTNSCTTTPCRTVQQAVDVATSGDEIRVATGVYTGVQARGGVTQVVYISKTVTVRGGYTTTNWATPYPLTQPTVLDAQRQGRVMYIGGNFTPTLDGFTIANGNATGLIANCDENRPDGCGGGIFSHDAHPIIVNNIITNNVAAVTTAGYPTGTTGYGGGLYLSGATRAVISGNLIISNVAGLANCGNGGGIYLDRYSNVSGAQVQFNQVFSNTATTTNLGCAWGGGITGGPDGVVIRGNSIIGNRANGYGGGQGAGIYQWYGSATYLNNLVTGNLGSVSGQAIYLGYSRARFEGNRVEDNATSQGIRLVNGSGGGPTLVNNVVARSGDRTFAATGHVSAPLIATLLHNTLVGSGSGSGVYVETDSVTLFMTNTIIVSHTWGITNTFPASSTVQADRTLFWANTNDGIRGINPVDGDPVFASDGYHIGPGSAAINAGVNAGVTTDIDGETRPSGSGYDIGADEFYCMSACFEISKEHTGSLIVGLPLTYTLSVTNAGTEDGTSIVITDALPAGAGYLEGGSFEGGVVSWTVSSLAVGQQAMVSFAVSTCQTSLTNQWYRVASSDQGATSNWGAALTTSMILPTLNAAFDYGPSPIIVGKTAMFTSTSTTNGSPLTYDWDWGDGLAHAFTANATHAYSQTGAFTARLTITDACGFSDYYTTTLNVDPRRIYLPVVMRN